MTASGVTAMGRVDVASACLACTPTRSRECGPLPHTEYRVSASTRMFLRLVVDSCKDLCVKGSLAYDILIDAQESMAVAR